MIEVKKSVAVKVPVYFINSSGNPVPSVLYSSVQCSVMKSNGTVVTLTVTSPMWSELSTGTFMSQGVYWLELPSSAVDTNGLVIYLVTSSGQSKPYRGALKVVNNEEAETKAVADSTNSIVTATKAEVDTIFAQVDDIFTSTFGKWEIKTTGPDANRLIMYDNDGTTVLKKFDLVDKAGVPTFSSPFKRTPL